ncbi:TRAPP subunit [Basidiobolus ranarum]|uniref:TRAPP subunit n=1 Tax=Basidiobolus ranarum TaxID=34480 RepID=A0ABR2X2X7_9FUNG
MSGFYFAIVGNKDNPIYEAEIGSPAKDAIRNEETKHLYQFVAHSALDVVDEMVWTTNALYLKTVDKYNEWFVSAYVTPSNVRLLLLHEAKNDDAIFNFFKDCHELYIRALLNPFYEQNALITSTSFDTKVRALARRYL